VSYAVLTAFYVDLSVLSSSFLIAIAAVGHAFAKPTPPCPYPTRKQRSLSSSRIMLCCNGRPCSLCLDHMGLDLRHTVQVWAGALIRMGQQPTRVERGWSACGQRGQQQWIYMIVKGSWILICWNRELHGRVLTRDRTGGQDAIVNPVE